MKIWRWFSGKGLRFMIISGVLVVVILAAAFYLVFAGSRKISANFQANLPAQETSAATFVWPTQGNGAIGLVNGDSVSCETFDSGDKRGAPRPTASVAKLITALVLSEHSEADREFMMDADDVALYDQIVAVGGSNLAVTVGEKLTFREILEGILIVSADNLADGAVKDVFGNFANYKTAAEDFLAKNGLADTKIGADASGLDAGTVSTPADLCKLTSLALKNPLVSEIMGEKTAKNSAGQQLENTNKTLGQQGIFAGKTGHTDEAGYNLVAAAKVKDQTIISVLLGQASYDSVFSGSENLVRSSESYLVSRKISAGETVGFAKSPDGRTVELVAKNDLAISSFANEEIKFETEFYARNLPLSQNETVGKISAPNGKSTEIVAKNAFEAPDFWWKVSHL